MTDASLRLATRGSPQARTQAQVVAGAITAVTGAAVELVLVETSGDRNQLAPLHTIGGQGVFVKEVQQAVLDGRADAAVHSAKDLPSETPAALTIGALCSRATSLMPSLDANSVSSRRGLSWRPVRSAAGPRSPASVPISTSWNCAGNIARRLDQVPPGGALVIAVAALEVLGLTERVAERLDPTVFVPAVGQGCVAVECRAER